MILSGGAVVDGPESVLLQLNNLEGSFAETVFRIDPAAYTGDRLDFFVETSVPGRHTYGVAKGVLMGEPDKKTMEETGDV